MINLETTILLLLVLDKIINYQPLIKINDQRFDIARENCLAITTSHYHLGNAITPCSRPNPWLRGSLPTEWLALRSSKSLHSVRFKDPVFRNVGMTGRKPVESSQGHGTTNAVEACALLAMSQLLRLLLLWSQFLIFLMIDCGNWWLKLMIQWGDWWMVWWWLVTDDWLYDDVGDRVIPTPGALASGSAYTLGVEAHGWDELRLARRYTRNLLLLGANLYTSRRSENQLAQNFRATDEERDPWENLRRTETWANEHSAEGSEKKHRELAPGLASWRGSAEEAIDPNPEAIYQFVKSNL